MLIRLKELATSYRRLLRWLLWIVIGLLLLIAILAGLTRALGSIAGRYQPQLTTYISQQLELPVKVGQLTLSWYGLNPEVVLNDIVVTNKSPSTAQILTVRHLALQLSLFDTLLKRRLMIKGLVLKNINVAPDFYQQLDVLKGHASGGVLPWDNIRVKVTDLNTPVQGKLPGLKNANFAIQLHQRTGQFEIKDDNWILDMPWLFREPLKLTDTDLSGTIKFGNTAFSMSIKDGELSVPEGTVTVQLVLRVPKVGHPDIDLDAKGEFENLTRESVYNYMPIAVLSPSLLHWLDNSILHVDGAQSHFVMRGQMQNFPFINNNGEFLVDSQLQGASLAFEPNWPIVANAKAHMVFKGQSMLITANQGEFAGLPIQEVSAKIPVMAINQPLALYIGAKVQTDVAKLIPAINQMPLTSITRLSKQLGGEGPATVGITIALPLENVPDMTPKIKGYANLQQVKLNLVTAPRMPLSDVTGLLNFTEQGLTAKAVSGQWLGMPVTASLTQGAVAGETQVLANLRVSTLPLKPWLPADKLRFIKGQTDLQLQMLASLTDVPSIQLSTNMQGMAVTLPPPFQKTAAAKVPTQIQVTEVAGQGWQIKAGYGSGVNVQAMVARVKQQLTMTALALGWGGQPKLTPQQITVTLNQPSIDLTSWFNLLQAQKPVKQEKTPMMPIQLQINTQQLALRGYNLTGVNLQTGYDGKQLTANVVSKQITGKVTYQLPTSGSKEQLQVNLKQLNLPGANLSSSQNMKWQRFPATQFSCGYLQVGKLILGQVAVTLTPTAGGLNINQFKLTTKAITVNASGSWLWQSARTQLSGSLNTSNLSQALRDLGLSGNISATQANAQFKLNWAGAPWQVSPSALSGSASLNIGSGKITGLSQSADASVGLGKLISLLSLEGLMRIGDIGSEGFAFDKITGQFQFNQGSVDVGQSEIKGVVADLFFQGQINLTQQTYNLRMQVVGRLTSSLPVIATIAGGPVVGAVTWVVNKAVGPALDKASSSTYKITGTWQKPVISKGS